MIIRAMGMRHLWIAIVLRPLGHVVDTNTYGATVASMLLETLTMMTMTPINNNITIKTQ